MNPTKTELSQAIISRILEASNDIPRTSLEQMSLASQLDLLFLLREPTDHWGISYPHNERCGILLVKLNSGDGRRRSKQKSRQVPR